MSYGCLVSIKIGGYEDKIWCDVIHMNIASIIFGRPWFFYWDVQHDEGQNIIPYCGKDDEFSSFHCNQQQHLRLHHYLQLRTKGRAKEEIKVMIAPKEIPSVTEEIKDDIDK